MEAPGRTAPTRYVSDVLPRSVVGPESLAATGADAASTFGADTRAGAAFQSCLAGAVFRPESFSGGLPLRRPLDCTHRGLWRTGSNGVFNFPAILGRRRALERLLGVLPDRPQRRANQQRPPLPAALHHRHRVTVEELRVRLHEPETDAAARCIGE